ncbi:MAG: hypothetical protein R3E86_04145 [Pseudomonadales bacterium]
MSRNVLEKIVFAFATAVLISAAWFWIGQVGSVLDTLRLAYG